MSAGVTTSGTVKGEPIPSADAESLRVPDEAASEGRARDGAGRFRSGRRVSRAEIERVSKLKTVRASEVAKLARTERTYLAAVRAEFSSESVAEIAAAVRARALEGDKDALRWVGKYLLGGGAVSLAEIDAPAVIRRSRGR